MKLKSWRDAQGLTIGTLTSRLNFLRTERAIARIEAGENGADSDVIAAIQALTDGAVTAQDMHETRLAWLKLNRPEKFVVTTAVMAAARFEEAMDAPQVLP